ncbi:ABC transporter ATP-binding protein [SAR86 cluster bacterium]|nr:ABC transporter ATP-binding protein [SAR86 cluster bacterium]
MSSLLSINGLEKVFLEDSNPISAVKDISFDLRESEILVIFGRSGSGKTTLLHLIAGLESISQGSILFQSNSINEMSPDELTLLRRDNIGFVYQFHHLVNEFTAIENVSLPLILNGSKRYKANNKAKILLNNFGLGHRENHKPSELSGGERQRVAICRALINEPSLVLLDEPTGDLDRETAEQVIKELKDYLNNSKASLIIATHDKNFEKIATSIKTMDSGIFI